MSKKTSKDKKAAVLQSKKSKAPMIITLLVAVAAAGAGVFLLGGSDEQGPVAATAVAATQSNVKEFAYPVSDYADGNARYYSFKSPQGLDIRYFSGPRTIPVTAVISAGIPSKAGSPDASSRFIYWLMLPETQSRLMARWERDGITVFGFLGGLSSLPEVNESILIRHYPAMKGMIPEGHYLSVPESLPQRWSTIRDDVIAPWFQSVVSDTGNTSSLSEAYRKWDLSSLAEAE